MVPGDLPARLRELVPRSGEILARAAVNAFRDVPWAIDNSAISSGGAARSGYSAADAVVGSRVIGDLMPNSLVNVTLANLLKDAGHDLDQGDGLLRRCGNFIALVMEQDIGLKEALCLFLSEDVDPGIAGRLAQHPLLQRCHDFLEATGIGTARAREAAITVPAEVVRDRRFLRESDLWDAPYALLEQVPEAASGFARSFSESVGRAARAPSAPDGPFDIVDAVVGRPLRNMAQPRNLVTEVVMKIIDDAFTQGEIPDDLILGCCEFIAVAVDADAGDGGHLGRILEEKISGNFARIALDSYHEESDFLGILHRVLSRPALQFLPGPGPRQPRPPWLRGSTVGGRV